MTTKQHKIETKNVIGEEMAECILFAHAVSGCDTTSAFYGLEN